MQRNLGDLAGENKKLAKIHNKVLLSFLFLLALFFFFLSFFSFFLFFFHYPNSPTVGGFDYESRRKRKK